MKELIKRIPVAGDFVSRLYARLKSGPAAARVFPGSEEYWQRRYVAGGNSGEGSYGKFAEFKAEILNELVSSRNIKSVIEFGCGDGNQLELANYPNYLGLDVSSVAISLCEKRFESDGQKRFKTLQDYANEKAELSLSLDVLYHLIEDDVFENHMRLLFSAATRYVVIYSSDLEGADEEQIPHVRQRQFTKWIAQNVVGWQLRDQIKNMYPYDGDNKLGTWSDFYVYAKSSDILDCEF